jgi:hypothetical protein
MHYRKNYMHIVRNESNELIPAMPCSAVTWVQMEVNVAAPVKVVNAQSDDQNHRN